jgi:hypothetical protein
MDSKLSVRVTPIDRTKIELLSRYKGISNDRFAEELLRVGIEREVATLPGDVARAIETLATETAKLNTDTPSDHGSLSLVEYKASRLRFVKSRVDELLPGGKLRIVVPDEGVFEFSKEEFETDFCNVLKAPCYNNAGYYHYRTVPKKALKYRVADNLATIPPG